MTEAGTPGKVWRPDRHVRLHKKKGQRYGKFFKNDDVDTLFGVSEEN